MVSRAAETNSDSMTRRRWDFRPATAPAGFAEECARQAAIADVANRADPELSQLEEAVAADIAEHIDALEAGKRE